MWSLIVTGIYIGSMAPVPLNIAVDGAMTKAQCDQAKKSVARTLSYLGAKITRATCERER